MYEALMLAMAGEYRLLAPDLPGMGQSDALPPPLTVAAMAAAVGEFLDELGVDRCFVFGHHTGASVAAELAANLKERVVALALSGPPLLDDDLRARLPALAKPFPACRDGTHLRRMWQRINGKDESASLEIVERETLSGIALGRCYADAYDAVIAHDMRGALEALTCPVLVFAGTADVLYRRLDDAHALLARGARAEIDGAGTFACETHCREVNALLGDFFQGAAA
jgi:pimeloyl-ACP methyl ester carboxylesterase